MDWDMIFRYRIVYSGLKITRPSAETARYKMANHTRSKKWAKRCDVNSCTLNICAMLKSLLKGLLFRLNWFVYFPLFFLADIFFYGNHGKEWKLMDLEMCLTIKFLFSCIPFIPNLKSCLIGRNLNYWIS